ncbi:restriction endonuclease subunit S [Vibrio parahaemolyticus]|nr:restriction endonuclease subunit S [Vibrio parahaemolyticus]MCF9039721.1 restriction endonuclease subunit S [Vibrio parahaemolyticus]
MVPNGWELSCIGDISKTTMGFAFKSKDFVKNGIPLIRMGNLYQNKLQLDRSPIFLPPAFSDEYARFILRAGDLVMSMTGTMGKRDYGFTVQIPKGTPDSLLNQRVMKFDARHNSSLDFLKYLLRSEYVLTRLYAFPGGTKQANLSATQVSEIPVLLPPLPEQRKIAKILSTWDKAITTTEKLIETSKQQKKALMQQLLTGKKRLVNPETGKAFEGDWEEVKLGEVAQCLDNKRVPLNGEQRSDMQGQYPYWGANGIVDYINEYIFDEPIVLLAEDGGYFDEYASRPIANISYGKCWVNNHAHIIKALSKVTNEWLYFSLVHKNIMAFINGGTRAKLNKKDMLLIKIQLPSLLEQQKIVLVLTAADKEIEILEAKLAHFKQEKKALMQQLLTGKRRVKVDEEVAA